MNLFRFIVLTGWLGLSFAGQAQNFFEGKWLFTLTREGGIPVHVTAEIGSKNNEWHITFLNDTERILAEPIQLRGDSLYFSMPLFETNFSLKADSKEKLKGIMAKGTSVGPQLWQAEATAGPVSRIPQAIGDAAFNITGRWAMEFQRADGSWRPAVAEWKQTGNKLTGTIINPSGDYRFLEGSVWQNKLYVTAFDGAHVYAFQATILNDTTLEKGLFFSGKAPGDAFRAKKNPNAKLPELAPVAELKPGERSLFFQFPDIDSNLVSLSEARFKNKVVIVQLMGSWCPNCMDETKFLSDFYNAQKIKEVEIISLAYELSTDFNRSSVSLRKFRQRFGVQYPMLITGVRSSDEDKAIKTLPQLTDIKYFPTTIFIDKKGLVQKVHNGFYGPGAPEYFEQYKKEFYEILDQLRDE